MTTGFLALLAAGAWGAGDFISGLVARRIGPFLTVLLIYVVGLATLVAVVLIRGERLVVPADLMWGAAGGLVGAIGLAALLRGFEIGRMGVVAALSATVGAAIPVLLAALFDGLPRQQQLIGFGFALVAMWLLARPEGGNMRPAGVGLGMLAGVGFGGFFAAMDQVSGQAVFLPLVAARAGALAVAIALVASNRGPITKRTLPIGMLGAAGILDVAGNLFFLLAVQAGRLDVAAVVVSLYPAITALLARAIGKEHLAGQQVVGIGAALVAIALITA